MAEAALFSVAAKVLSNLASPAFQMAYERVCSIWYARDELRKLITTITTIQDVLLDAERKQSDSVPVKNWMNKVKDVLYDADDLFDEVATDDMLRKQMKGNKFMKKVRVTCSRLNPILSDDSIAKKVKSIREDLLAISEDMKIFEFAICRDDKPISRIWEGRDRGSFVDSKSVVGREDDRKAIVKMLLHESKQHVRVIAIVGIGGMGKTTLSQLVYDDKEVKKTFENRWFACISDSSDHAEVYGKICRSMDEDDKGNSSVTILQNKIKESIEGKKCLLVLDDVWDDDHARWQDRMSLLSRGAEGSKIIVSTRSKLVATAVGASEIHNLYGLSEKESWNLFKSVVGWTPEQENDRRWSKFGTDIVKKCVDVPLAIKITASLLCEKDTIQEWESISKEKLPWVGDDQNDGVMSVLKLSYEYLPSNLKHCFAYCSLFPKDHEFDKDELIHLWTAQGYINSVIENEVVKDKGDSDFLYFLRRSFFQRDGRMYRMHDLMHDLAMHVAGEETSLLSGTSLCNVIGKRHVSIGYVAHDSWVPPEALHSLNRRRSLLFMCTRRAAFSELDQCIPLANWKYLRALKLSLLEIENISSSIGELKQLRYLDISLNNFKELPNSITKLVNLCTLNISFCTQLETLPSNFGKLVSLRNLYNNGCTVLKHLPAGFEQLNLLQHLSELRVRKRTDGSARFSMDGLSQLKLKGELHIWFDSDADDWDGLECWNPPPTLEELHIYLYSGIHIPNWGNGILSSPPNLTSLTLQKCTSIKCLPSFRHIPNIRILDLETLNELEYIEEEALFIPNLDRLRLWDLPKLKGWSRKECSTSPLASSLTYIYIFQCPELILNRPISVAVSTLNSSLHWIFPGDSLTSLRELHIYDSNKLKKVELPPSHLNNLEVLELLICPELEPGIDWESLPKLCELDVEAAIFSSAVMLPDCLQRLQQLGQLKISLY